MSNGVGAAFGPPGYRLIDADSHVNEPPDLWTSRVAAKYRDRVPHFEHFEEGDGFVIEGGKARISFGMNAAAGLLPEEATPWVRWEDIRPGGYDPKARLEEMDIDAVDASALYPTPRLSQLMIATQDPELHLVMVQAYNDWLSEYCSYDPSRLGGLMLIPNRGVADAVAEIERVAERPGIIGGLIGCYPHGDLNLNEEDDAVWKALAQANLALHIHVSLQADMPIDVFVPGLLVSETQAKGDLRFLNAPVRIHQLVFAGVFDHVPNLTVVLAEVDAGWVPAFKEQLDNRALRKTPGAAMRLRELPSAIVEEHFYYTYITDHFAIRNRDAIGVERLMWSSDFPHSGSDWPRSRQMIHADFAGVPAKERDLILSGNAQRLYHFDKHQPKS